jgi:hypothetical protein
MNCTNHNYELPPLKARCNELGIHIPAHNPTAAQIIPCAQERLADHQKHFAKTMDPSTGYYREWKSLNDDLTDFLKELGATQPKTMPPIPPISFTPPAVPPAPTHQNNFSPQNPPQSGSTPEHQHSTPKSEVGSGESLVGSAGFVVGFGGFKPTSSESNPSKKSSAPAQSDAATKDEPFDIRQHLDDASMRVCEDLQEFLSGRSPIDNLTPQQQNVILRLLEEHNAARVAEVLAQPEPYGMNFKTSDSSLNRFRDRIRLAEKKRLNSDQEAATKELIAKAHDSDEAFQAAVQRFIKTRLLNATASSHSSLDAIDSMITSLTKLRKQTLAERKQLHAEKTK